MGCHSISIITARNPVACYITLAIRRLYIRVTYFQLPLIPSTFQSTVHTRTLMKHARPRGKDGRFSFPFFGLAGVPLINTEVIVQ